MKPDPQGRAREKAATEQDRTPERGQSLAEPMTPPRYDDLPEMVTVEEMSAYLRVSRNVAYELVKSGTLRSVRYGRLIRIPKQALLEGK